MICRRTLAFYLKRLAHRFHSNNLHVTDNRLLFKFRSIQIWCCGRRFLLRDITEFLLVLISIMTGRGSGGRGKVLLPPINFIFKLLQQRSTVSIWLFEQFAIRIEGKIRVPISQPHKGFWLLTHHPGIRRIHESSR